MDEYELQATLDYLGREDRVVVRGMSRDHNGDFQVLIEHALLAPAVQTTVMIYDNEMMAGRHYKSIFDALLPRLRHWVWTVESVEKHGVVVGVCGRPRKWVAA